MFEQWVQITRHAVCSITWKNAVLNRERCLFFVWKLWSLSFPVTSKKPFSCSGHRLTFFVSVFVLGCRSKNHFQAWGLWSVRAWRFIRHPHPTILITSASWGYKSVWQATKQCVHVRMLRLWRRLLKKALSLLLKLKISVTLNVASSLYTHCYLLHSSVQYLTDIQTATYQHTHTHTHRHRGLIDFSVCQEGGKTELGGSAPGPTGSDLMSKKMCACFSPRLFPVVFW